MIEKKLNYLTLLIFAPLLILTGIAGFVISGDGALTSGAPLYSIFHLLFGSLGIIIVWSRKDAWIRSFNVGFGIIDLYQALASHAHLFPERFFRWTNVDVWLHIIIGLALVIIGGYGTIRRSFSIKSTTTR